MTDEMVIEEQTVIVEGGTITTIGPSSELTLPECATIIDGQGAYLMPGLADMHMHTSEDWLSGTWPVSPLSLYLANGVTTIRDFGQVGRSTTYVLDWRDAISAGILTGPAIYSSGEILFASPLDDPEGIVQEHYDQGYDFIKVYSYLSLEDFEAVIAAADERGMYTAGHIPFPVGLDGVLTTGMDEIAHVEELLFEFIQFDRGIELPVEEWLPYLADAIIEQNDISGDFDEEIFRTQHGETLSAVITMLQAADVPFCTTLIIDDLIVEKLFTPETFLSRPELTYMPQAYLDRFRQGTEKHQQQFRGIEDLAPFKYGLDLMLLDELHQTGIPLLLGTDSGSGAMGSVPGYSIHDELCILVENGFTPYEAIQTGTVNASRAIEAMTGEGGFGTIEVGSRADLILVRDNPLEDVANIRNPLGVMAAGRWYSGETLEQMVAITHG
jgi:hypothetical protein